jgi:hypothetical protein
MHHRFPRLGFANGISSRGWPLWSLAVSTPAPALCLGDSGAPSLGLRTGRQTTVKAAARLAELDPDHAGPARSGLGATARSIFASPLPPEV